MVKITEELIRKKSEHNELLISTLEELSLHQENIEKLEYLQNWCKDLKILLLQSNLIPKIENLQKLKKLEYLNLAINNIEKIENLEQLESLKKLDFTLNFIGELTSIESLKYNYNLEELTLTGNPCTDYSNYRDYVITILPQLIILDGKEITRSERFKARKEFNEIRKKIIQHQIHYQIKRDEQKIRIQEELERDEVENKNLDDEEKMKKFWEKKSEHCPEVRIEIAKNHAKSKRENTVTNSDKKSKKYQLKLFAPCGRPYNINEAKINFNFHDESDRYELDLHVYKYLDTTLINVDVQPNYVRVIVKGKHFQLVLLDEVKISETITQRSLITGHLLIIIPKLNAKKILQFDHHKQIGNIKNYKNDSNDLNGTVDYKNIIKASTDNNCIIDESEIPSLI